MNDYFKRVNHPAISWSVIIAAVGLGGSGLWSANSVENLALSNQQGLSHEKELRISEQLGLKEDLDELKQDTKDIKQELKDETTEIKGLLQQLLLRQVVPLVQ